jgi:hypothetical protein
MGTATLLSKGIFEEIKPDFHVLRSLKAKNVWIKNNRLKCFSKKNQNYEIPSSKFNISNNSDSKKNFKGFCQKVQKNITVINNVGTEKIVKFFNLKFLDSKLDSCSLIKKGSFGDNVTFIENSRKNIEHINFKEEYIAIGTDYGVITVWNTEKIIEEEPNLILENYDDRDLTKSDYLKNKIFKKPVEKKKLAISCLRWGLESTSFIFSGNTSGLLNYWDITVGKEIFRRSIKALPIFNLTIRKNNKNEISFLNGDYESYFVDTRKPNIIFKETFEKKVMAIEWLNCENFYTVIEDSGTIYLKDIRFNKNSIYSKNIYENNLTKKINFYQFSPEKKNLFIIDDKNNFLTLKLNGVALDTIKSGKISNPLKSDFFWLNWKNNESLLMVENDYKISIIKNKG